MFLLRLSKIVPALSFILLVSLGCGESGSGSISLRQGRHYRIEDVETGWTERSGYMNPFIEFDIVNNGTDDISAMTVKIGFLAPAFFTASQTSLLEEKTRTITGFSSGEALHYSITCSRGYRIEGGDWDQVTGPSTRQGQVRVGVMFSSQSQVSSDNTDYYEIQNSNIR